MQRDVLLAAILGAHGLKGEVRVKTFTETPDSLGAYGPLHAKDGCAFTLESVRPGKDGEIIAAFVEVRDREAAEALKGTELFVSRAALPAAGNGEFYHADLVGLEAVTREGVRLGRVASLLNYGAGDILEIAKADGETLLLPFTNAIAPEIDFEAGRIFIEPPVEVEVGPDAS